MNERLSHCLAPGERVVLQARTHWGRLACPLLLSASLMAWGTLAASFLLIAGASAMLLAASFEGEALTAVTGRRLLVLSVPSSGRSFTLSLVWR